MQTKGRGGKGFNRKDKGKVVMPDDVIMSYKMMMSKQGNKVRNKVEGIGTERKQILRK